MRLLTFVLLFLSSLCFGQSAASYTVMLEVDIVNTTDIKLTWNNDANATGHVVYRKATNDVSWGTPIATLSGNDSTYTDQGLDVGVEYEYRLVRSTGSYTAFGYTHSAIELELPAFRGDMLLIVEDSIAFELASEVLQLQEDLQLDGWRVQTFEVSADTSVTYVKSLITDAYTALSALKMVYLLGHVPVPYSGNIAPDGHSNHIGAWPADVFYGDVNGTWSDNTVNNTSASDARNHNVPADGRYDESTLPSNAELMVGRVDFSNLTLFSVDEVELTRRYLERAHAFKHGGWTLPKRALIDDNFGGFGGEAFASNGWRNFSPLIGRDSIVAADYRTTLATQGYLFSYGCGGGSHTSAGGIGNSTQLASDSLQTAFTQLFGSYFGDWDRQDNFLRSALAQGRTLTISWSGRPHWHYQSMGMGYPVGYSALLSQNNTSLYTANYGAQSVHVALLGDPSLRMEYPVSPVSMSVDSIDTFHVVLDWTWVGSTQDDVFFNVYRKKDGGEFERVNETPIEVPQTFFIDSCVIFSGDYSYLVKAAHLVENFSGSYYNESLGIPGQISFQSSRTLNGNYQVSHASNWLTLECTDPYAKTAAWDLGDTIVHGLHVNVEISKLGEIAGATLPYTVSIENDCQTEQLQGEYAFDVLGVDRPSLLPAVHVYPNPTSAGTLLNLVSDQPIQSLTLIALDGRVILQHQRPVNQINIPDVAPGMYFIECHVSQQQHVLPVLIE